MTATETPRLLTDAEFADAMTAVVERRGHSMSAEMLPDDPNALAFEGGGDDPAACLCGLDPDTDPDTGLPLNLSADAAGGGEQLRQAGGWRATWLADVFRAEGLVVVEVDGWRSRGVPYPDDPAAEGVSLFHHTASNRASGPAGGLRIVTYGRPGLPGPIANWLTARNGIVYVVASGVSNNAGRGNARAAGLPNVTGNANTFGDEMENDGLGEPYSAVQYTAAIKAHAAVHRRLGWPAARGIGHKEWSVTGKPDPKLDMAQVRRDLAAAITGGSAPTPGGDDEVDQKTGEAILREIAALNEFLMTGRRYGKAATSPPDSEQIGTLHKLLQSVDRRGEETNRLLETLIAQTGTPKGAVFDGDQADAAPYTAGDPDAAG